MLFRSHSLNVKYVKDVVKLNSKEHGKILSRIEINALYKKAKFYAKNNSERVGAIAINHSLSLERLNPPLDKRIHTALQSIEITNLAELNLFSEVELLRSPRIGRGEMNQIRELATKYGIQIKKR